jgi:hemerythrin-like domain-containing protein
MPDTLALWHAEHVNFARLLNLLDEQLALFHSGATPDYELMLNVMFYMTHYSDVLHHPKEDLVFAKIKEREPATARTVDDLAHQHAHIKESGAALVRALDDILNGSVTSRADVEATARDYVATLRGHMRVEETEVLPLAARLLSARDWAAIHAKIGHAVDPLFGAHPEIRYVALHAQITRHGQVARTIP